MAKSAHNRLELLGLGSRSQIDQELEKRGRAEKAAREAEEAAKIDHFDFKAIPASGIKTADTKYRFWYSHEGLVEEVGFIGQGDKGKHLLGAFNRDPIATQIESSKLQKENRSDDRLAEGRDSLTYQALKGYAELIEATAGEPPEKLTDSRVKQMVKKILARYHRLLEEVRTAGQEQTLIDLASGDFDLTKIDTDAQMILDSKPTEIERFKYKEIPQNGIDADQTPYRFWVDVDRDGVWRELRHIDQGRGKNGEWHPSISIGGLPLNKLIHADDFRTEDRAAKRLASGTASRTYQALRACLKMILETERAGRDRPDIALAEKMQSDFNALVEAVAEEGEIDKLIELAENDGWHIGDADEAVKRMSDKLENRPASFDFDKIPPLGVMTVETPFRFWVESKFGDQTFWREVGMIIPDPKRRGFYTTRNVDKSILRGSYDQRDFVPETRDSKRLLGGSESLTFLALKSYYLERLRIEQRQNKSLDEQQNARLIQKESKRLLDELFQNGEWDEFLGLISKAKLPSQLIDILNADIEG